MNQAPYPLRNPPPAGVLRHECCARCKWSNPAKDGPPECRRNPPTIAPVILPGPRAGTAQVKFVTEFPRVNPEHWCGEFKPKIEAAS